MITILMIFLTNMDNLQHLNSNLNVVFTSKQKRIDTSCVLPSQLGGIFNYDWQYFIVYRMSVRRKANQASHSL